jgi:hypothetical protein
MPRTRPRKRRSGGARRTQAQDGGRIAPSRAPKTNAPPRARASRSSPTASTYGERPPAPWHPLPLSELLILVGALGFALGLRRGISSGGPVLLAGIAALAIGTFEVTLREHRSGYRSHTVMLALLPVLIFHSLVIFLVSVFTTAPRLLNVGLFAIDIALFAFLFRMLRARFLDARHARVLKEG